MGQFRQTTHIVTLTAAGGAAPSARVWDLPTSVPLTKLSISISSAGTVTAAGNLAWEVFLGGVWAGTPFDADSTHSGGVSQTSGTIAGSAEVAAVVYTTNNLLATNNVVGPNPMVKNGLPIVLELTNAKASAVTVYVTFVSEIVGIQS